MIESLDDDAGLGHSPFFENKPHGDHADIWKKTPGFGGTYDVDATLVAQYCLQGAYEKMYSRDRISRSTTGPDVDQI
jgi:hypothetical protein